MMRHEQKKAYLETIRRRYKKSTRQEKALILDEFCSVCKYNRKYAVRLLGKKQNEEARTSKSIQSDPIDRTLLIALITPG